MPTRISTRRFAAVGAADAEAAASATAAAMSPSTARFSRIVLLIGSTSLRHGEPGAASPTE